jgi:hypothetical protein
MSTPVPRPSPADVPSAPSRTWRTLRLLALWSTRLGLAAAIGVLGAYTLGGIAEFRRPTETPQPSPPTPPFCPEWELLAAGPGTNYWNVAGMNLVMREEVRTDLELEALIARSRSTESLAGAAAQEEAQLCRDVRALSGTTSEPFWRLDRPRLVAWAVFCPSGGVDRLAQFGFAAKEADQSPWRTFQVLPENRFDGEEFLPLPEGSRRLASRRDSDGRLQCAIVRAPRDLDTLSREWTTAGWTVDRSSETHSGFSLTCTRAAEQVYAWVPSATPRETILVLSRR